jgi:hypothetical protein
MMTTLLREYYDNPFFLLLDISESTRATTSIRERGVPRLTYTTKSNILHPRTVAKCAALLRLLLVLSNV